MYNHGGVAKLVIALACHAGDHGFEPRRSRNNGCLKSRLLFRQPIEFKIKSVYCNDLILNIAPKIKEAVQKLQFLNSPIFFHAGKTDERAIAQLVARLVRDQEVGGSNPPCPTANSLLYIDLSNTGLFATF